MKRTHVLTALLALLFALFVSLTAFAQDADTDTPTPEVAATQEATALATVEPTAEATPEVVTATPQATPIVIIITQAPDVPPVDPAPEPTPDAGTAFATIGWVLFLLTLSALGFVLVTWIRELRKSAAAGDQNSKNLLAFANAARDMLPVDVLLTMVDRLDARAKATPTPGEIDDKVSDQIRAIVYEILGRELPVDPTTPGEITG